MANTDTTTEGRNKRRAEHYWLDSDGRPLVTKDGKPSRDLSAAMGLRYVDLETREAFDWLVTAAMPKAKAGTVGTMLALFGARTLATNTASAARQEREKGLDDTSDIEAIRYRFETELRDGQWTEPGEGGGGPRYNAETLARAINALRPDRSVEDALARIKADPEYAKGAYENAGVKAHYARIRAEARLAAANAAGKAPATDNL